MRLYRDSIQDGNYTPIYYDSFDEPDYLFEALAGLAGLVGVVVFVILVFVL